MIENMFKKKQENNFVKEYDRNKMEVVIKFNFPEFSFILFCTVVFCFLNFHPIQPHAIIMKLTKNPLDNVCV